MSKPKKTTEKKVAGQKVAGQKTSSSAKKSRNSKPVTEKSSSIAGDGVNGNASCNSLDGDQKFVTVRMYNMGFGDCFLLTFPGTGRRRKILIDCGKHTASTCLPKLKDVVAQVHQDLKGDDDIARLDLLVVTHRHLDHVAGFGIDGWNDIEVGQVWMPWVEDPKDPAARRICETQSMRALQLQQLIPALQLSARESEYLLGYAGNNLTNAAAMEVLHNGLSGSPKRRFLPEKDVTDPLQPTSALLPGVEIYVLGPSRSENVIRDMDPPPGEAFLRAATAEIPGNTPPPVPFSKHLVMNRAEYEQWFEDLGLENPLSKLDDKTLERIGKPIDDPVAELMVNLEKAVNGTSLVLLIKCGQAVMLFPGDAQWGTWNEILESERWQKAFKDLTFYKVGHHGSHNATPRRFVNDHLPQSAYAMVPTDDVKKWPMIPNHNLLTRLSERNIPFVRSDKCQLSGDPSGFSRKLLDGETLYIDLDLPC